MNDTGKDIVTTEQSISAAVLKLEKENAELRRLARHLGLFRSMVQSSREKLWNEIYFGKFFGKTKRLRAIADELDEAWIRSL